MVRRIAKRVVSRLPASIELDDLYQVGMLAAWLWSQHWNPALGSAERYLSKRVRGEMLDELRRLDLLTRDDRAQLKRIQRVKAGLPPDAPIATVASMTGLSIARIKALQDLGWRAQPCLRVEDETHCEDLPDESIDADPYNRLLFKQLLNQAQQRVDSWPTRCRDVFIAVYIYGLPQHEVATIHRISQARISQVLRWTLADLMGYRGSLSQFLREMSERHRKGEKPCPSL